MHDPVQNITSENPHHKDAAVSPAQLIQHQGTVLDVEGPDIKAEPPIATPLHISSQSSDPSC